MRRRMVILIIALITFYSFLICGCNQHNFDGEQVYHQGFEELEHKINSELGDYLTIVRYQNPQSDSLFIQVYFRSSYCDNQELVEKTPMWLIVDRFRCIFNDYWRLNPEFFDEQIEEILVCFYRDIDGHPEERAGLSNTVNGQAYDLLVAENAECGQVDYSQFMDREDIISLSLGYHDANDNPTIDECFNYLSEQIELFPNLECVTLMNVRLSGEDRSVLIDMLFNEYEDIHYWC